MPYATFTEIQADFKSMTFAAGFNITDTAVTEFILEADALINSYVGSVYVVPIAAGEALILMKLLSRSLVTNRVKKIMEVKQEKSTDANQNVVSVLLPITQVMKILTDIQNKVSVLAGATLLDARGGFYSNNVANNVCPTIKKDSKQW